MTDRSELAHRRVEARAKVMNEIANRAFTRKESGLDKVAKGLVRRMGGEPIADPDLEHEPNTDQGDVSPGPPDDPPT